jgi:predicted transcriptional regulator of viral defense system
MTDSKLPTIFRIKDLGLSRSQINALINNNKITKLYRGIYYRSDYEFSENISMAAVAKVVPNAIFCLLTALRFHGIGTQDPAKIWIAVHYKANKPSQKDLPIQVCRFSGNSIKFGVQKKIVDNVPIQITDPARTIVDCFRYRNKIGLDVALEALSESLKERKVSRDDINRAAQAVGGSTIIKPYMEAYST